MVDYIGLFIGGLILFFSIIFVWNNFYSEKFNFIDWRIYLSTILLTIFSIASHIYINAFFKVIIVTFFMGFINWFIFRKKINEVILSTILGQLILNLCDSLFIFICSLLFNGDTNFVKNIFFDTLIANIAVSILYVGICSIPFIKYIYLKILNFTERIKIKNLVFAFILLIVSINFLEAIIYYYMKLVYVIVINSFLIIIYSYIFYKAMNEKNDNELIKIENKSLMESLNEYENMVDRQRVDNHENKNQLLIIKNMIKKEDKDVVKYIDTIVKDEKEDDEALYTKVKTIPTGGLQGIIYQKMLTMKDEKILFSLDVSRDVRKIDLSNFSIEDNYKLCKIVGVFLDNAIEESRKLDEKIIMISLYIDEEMLIIDISNRFNGVVDVDKIDKEGYTTKGNGHGYGLSLVKKIVDESKGKFINERKVTKDVFKQVIKVKIDNKKC